MHQSAAFQRVVSGGILVSAGVLRRDRGSGVWECFGEVARRVFYAVVVVPDSAVRCVRVHLMRYTQTLCRWSLTECWVLQGGREAWCGGGEDPQGRDSPGR
jgi:hypothetical protein